MLTTTPEVRDWFDELLALGRSKNTIQTYTVALEAVHRAVAAVHGPGRSFLSLTRAEIVALLPYLRERYTVATMRQQLVRMKCFYSWGVATERISRSPMLSVPLPVPPRTVQRAFTETEALSLVREMGRQTRWYSRDLAMLILALGAGLRGIEIVEARVSLMTDDPADGGPGIVVVGKGGNRRWVPFAAPVREALAAYLPERAARLRQFGHEPTDTDRLFITGRPLARFDTTDPARMEMYGVAPFSRLTRPWIRAIGVEGAGSHATRRAFATIGCAPGGGFDPFLMSQALGHNEFDQLRRYRVLSRRELASAFEAHPLNRLLGAELARREDEAA